MPEMTEGEQLRKFIDNQPKSKIGIARDLGMSKQNLFGLFKSGYLSEDTKKKFEDYFGKSIFTHDRDGNPQTFNEASPSYLEQRRQQKNNTQLKYTAPFFPIKAQAGYVRARDQEMYVDTLERYALPPGVNPQGAIWRYWEVEGSSMEPTFRSGDIILTAQVHQFDWENLKNFYVYVIVTNEVILIKRIFCKNELEWVLISENEDEYPQQLLPVEFVKEVWIFRRKIESKAPPVKMFEIKV